MKRFVAAWLGLGLLVFACGGVPAPAGESAAGGGGTAILDTKSVWRVFATQRQPVVGTAEKAEPIPPDAKTMRTTITDLPAADWAAREFYDVSWLRRPGPFYGNPYGFGEPRSAALLCLRAGFLVADPGKASEMKLSVAFRGGLRVYLNGKELVRKNLREGEITLETLAEDYPLEAYVTADGAVIDAKSGPAAQKDRCEKRVRRLDGFAIPAKSLVKGLNVLALEVHRAAISAEGNKPGGDWGSVGVMEVKLTAPGADAVTPNLARPKGFQVWAANNFDIVRDVDFGDPCDSPKPVRICGVRNGEFCGVVVASSDAPIKGLQAQVGDLALAGGGGSIPSSAIKVRYALIGSKVGDNYGFIKSPVNSYDTLADAPPAEVAVAQKELSGDSGAVKPVWGAVQPVWIVVKVPADAKPGDYEGKVAVQAEGAGKVEVPVRLKVDDWKLPDTKEYRTLVDFIGSPESVALRYGVPFWSEKHFALLDKSLEQLGRIGNTTVYLPLICQTNMGNAQTMVLWIKKPDGGYEWDFTPMEKYLDICEKRLGKPKVVCCYLWDTYMEGGWHAGKIDGALVSSVDPATKSVVDLKLPKPTSAEGQPIWKAFAVELQARIRKRGLEKSMMIGMASDSVPNKETTEYWKGVLPEVPWVAQGHAIKFDLNGVPIGFGTTVWNYWGPMDPAKQITHGWQRPTYLGIIGRKSPWLVGGNDRDIWKGPYEGQVVDSRVKGERDIHCQTGFGRMSADFWACLKDAKGQMTSGLSARYPHTSWQQLNLRQIPYLAPGPDGAVPTVRFELMREGVQESEARIFIDEALLDKAKRAKLGEELAKKLQVLLDARTRAVLYGYQTGWQERSEKLYAAAAEAAKALGAQ